MHRRRVLALYKNILRLHRMQLPAPMQVIGDAYVREEFKLHKDAPPAQAAAFLDGWRQYLKTLRTGDARDGRDLSDTEKQALRGDQKDQLDKLAEEIRA